MSQLKKSLASLLQVGDVLEYKRANLIKSYGLTVLSQTIELLVKHDLYYWVDGGTLLGIVRDGGFIENDTDIDLAIIDNKNILYEILLNNGYNISYYCCNDENKKRLIRAEIDGVGIDFEIFYRDGDKYYYDASRDLPSGVESKKINQKAIFRYEFNGDLIDERIAYDFEDIQVMIPKNYEDYFLVYYKNWSQKIKKKDYLQSYFSYSVDTYKHHNKLAYYVKNHYLYLTTVNQSTIRLTFKDFLKYHFLKRV